jgi:hypothetical protein
MSRDFWKGFAFRSVRGFQILIHVDDAFCYLCMMRHCVLYGKLCLLQWLNLSFSIFQFSPLLISLTAILRHNDTLTTYFCLHLLVLACHVPRLF